MKKIGFVTCVQLGLSCIEEIYKIGEKLELLITLKDDKAQKKSGRVFLDEFSKKNNIPLLKINNINDEMVLEKIKEYDLDWLFIIGWSQIARKELLLSPKKGCIGMHPTLLPEGRGRAAIPWAILKKLSKTGVTMFKLDEGVDTGDLISQIEIPLDESITATELYQKVNDVHIELISKNLKAIINDEIVLKTQDKELATEWPGRTPDDGEIFNDMSLEEALLLIRATTKPYPGAFIRKDNKKIIIWKAEKSLLKGDVKLKDGYLSILEYEVKEC
ncbi:formyltransferase family protein [Cetobacterium sp.]|uniref:formyltransferase family protein n=1 Tax=Cetobacterium sp. TaxID=2071632 RepID=UPI003F2AFC40